MRELKEGSVLEILAAVHPPSIQQELQLQAAPSAHSQALRDPARRHRGLRL